MDTIPSPCKILNYGIFGALLLGIALGGSTSLAGTMGAAVLKAAKLENFSIPEAAKMGAYGGAGVGALVGFFGGISAAFPIGMEDILSTNPLLLIFYFLCLEMASGMTGFATENLRSTPTLMNKNTAAEAFSLGIGIEGLSAFFIFSLIGLMCVAKSNAKTEETDREDSIIRPQV